MDSCIRTALNKQLPSPAMLIILSPALFSIFANMVENCMCIYIKVYGGIRRYKDRLDVYKIENVLTDQTSIKRKKRSSE